MSEYIQTEADHKVAECLAAKQSFAMIAGAGSGKTASLIEALKLIRSEHSNNLRKNAQRVACITYTKRAVQVIASRLGHDDLYIVSTLHSFLWGEIKTFKKDIRNALKQHRLPQLIAKAADDDKGKSKKALKAREKITALQNELMMLDDVSQFDYEDVSYSNYSKGKLSHDDVIEIAGYLIKSMPLLRKALGFRFPFIFIDEAQDTFPIIIDAFNLVGEGKGFPVVGYFGDPWQQIYEQRAGDFRPANDGQIITKTENFRCSEKVIALLNAFRKDVEQYSAGSNKGRQGSVFITLIKAESPEAPRKRYSDIQLDRALKRMDAAVEDWGWSNHSNVIKLFLARQMIARRLGFTELNRLFTGEYASATAKENYESGEHFLLKPIINAIWPLVHAFDKGNQRNIIDLLRKNSPAFDVNGLNKNRLLIEMIEKANQDITKLNEWWCKGTLKDIFNFCNNNNLIRLPDQLKEHLSRNPRSEEYNEDMHGREKGDWLCDACFAMDTRELEAYCNFMNKNTVFSTQHGVKGEQYSDVLVVFDDIEAGWSHYNFSKLLTPQTAGEPTEGQLYRSQKLSYVCFSRAEENLRVLLYTENPVAARNEIVKQCLVDKSQINILPL